MNFTPQNVCGLLIRSRLMTPEEMRAMYQLWEADGGDNASSLGEFTKWLVAHRYVTDYQATLLAKGHGDPDIYFLGQYKILERLGRGRMAGVYKAVHTLGQTVAIKVLPPSRAKDPVMLGRFQREARLALRLKHPNVVRSFQIGQAGGLYYLVMEYLEGETLEDVLGRRQRLPPPEAVRLIHQALTGLEHIHELGLVHRDLKPANLMLVPGPAAGEPDTTARATVKILDIGLGRELFDENEPGARPPGTSPGEDYIELTGEGVILGTPDYLAPEQARDPRAIDIRADIYSLGCVLYHLLTGQPPFPDTNFINQMVRHATETPKPLQHFNPAIPDGLQQILNYMIAKQAPQRYPNPERAAQALQMFLMAESQAPVPNDEAPQMRKYLTWLETAPNEPEPAAPAEHDRSNVPVAKPLASSVRSSQSPAPTPLARSRSDRKKHKKHRRRRRVPIAQPAPLAGPQEFDVELVPMPGNSRLAPPPVLPGQKTFGLTGREWLLVGIGAAGLTIAVLIGVVIAWMIRPL
jgi:serine/threonine protein kinase